MRSLPASSEPELFTLATRHLPAPHLQGGYGVLTSPVLSTVSLAGSKPYFTLTSPHLGSVLPSSSRRKPPGLSRAPWATSEPSSNHLPQPKSGLRRPVRGRGIDHPAPLLGFEMHPTLEPCGCPFSNVKCRLQVLESAELRTQEQGLRVVTLCVISVPGYWEPAPIPAPKEGMGEIFRL